MSIKNFIKYLILNLLMVISLITFSNNEVLATKLYDENGTLVGNVYFEIYLDNGSQENDEAISGIRIEFINEASLTNLKPGCKCEIYVDLPLPETFCLYVNKDENNLLSVSCLKQNLSEEELAEMYDITIDASGIVIRLTDEYVQRYGCWYYYDNLRDLEVELWMSDENDDWIDWSGINIYNGPQEEGNGDDENGPEIDRVEDFEDVVESTEEEAYYLFYADNGITPDVKLEGAAVVATYQTILPDVHYPEWALERDRNELLQVIEVEVPETAVYNIEVLAQGRKIPFHVYMYGMHSDGRNKVTYGVGLAANGKLIENVITPSPTDESYAVDVILKEGYKYNVGWVQTDGPYEIKIIKRNFGTAIMRTTNIPSHVVSTDFRRLSTSDLDAYLDLVSTEDLAHLGIGRVEFEKDIIKEYILAGKKELTTQIEEAGWLESLITRFIISIGSIFLDVVEWLVGSADELSIDSLVFNNFSQTVIDLSPLGGVPVPPATNSSVFGQPEIKNIIKVLFDALKNFALVCYIVILLFIGVRILLSVGGKDQSKYVKYVQYWLTGLLLLLVVPYMLPVVPALNNAFIEIMQKDVTKMSGKYSPSEVIKKLGGDGSLLGEDAEVFAIRELINEKIEALEEKIQNAPRTREEAQATINSEIEELINTRLVAIASEKLNEYKNDLRERFDNVINFIDENYENFDEAVYNAKRKEIYSYMNVIFKSSSIADQELRDAGISDIVIGNPSIKGEIVRILHTIQGSAYTWNDYNESVLMSDLTRLNGLMSSFGLGRYHAETEIAIYNMKSVYINATVQNKQEIDSLCNAYRDAVLQEKIEELIELRDNIATDAITKLKVLAKEEGRMVYAIAWSIIVYQTFALLFMYYKRLIVIIVLIVIFPLVMIFYIFDKIGDGKAQSLQSWFREFLANIFVQVLHAALYVTVVNIGLEIYIKNPSTNWFFLIITVCLLFPAERMLRQIIGLSSSTLGELKNNMTGLALAAYGVKTLVTKGKDMASGADKQKEAEKIKKEQEEARKKAEEAEKRRKTRERSRRNREQRLKNHTASAGDYIFGIGDLTVRAGQAFAKTKAGARMVGAAKTTLRRGKNMMKYGKKAFKMAKKGFNLARKGYGATMGMLEGIENFSSGAGVLSAAGVAIKTADTIGGFTDKSKAGNTKVKKPSDTPKGEPSRFTSRYNNGSKVHGACNETAGNSNTSRNVNSSRVTRKLRSQLNTHGTFTGGTGSSSGGSSGGGSSGAGP